MATADSVKAKIQGLIDTANATTGESDTDLTAAVSRLIDGYGSGGASADSYDLLYEGGTEEPTLQYSVDLASIAECRKFLFVIKLTKPESAINLKNFIIYHNGTRTKCEYYCTINKPTGNYLQMRLVYAIERLTDDMALITRQIDETLNGTFAGKAIYPGYQQTWRSLTTSVADTHSNGFVIDFTAEIPTIQVTAYGVRNSLNAVTTTTNLN